jgi:Bifunctional DNA primase/polymerase, N-terminal/Family of unknown function (DUF5906)
VTSPLDIALDFIARGWNPVPVEYRTKKPLGNGWQLRVINASNAAQHFNGAQMNIGVVLGPTSHKLTDVDEDAAETICIGPYVLPKTKARFGRATKRGSHSLYYTDLSAIPGRPAVIAFDDPRKPKQQGRLIELRIGGDSGAQTVFPGSVHKTGEAIGWEEDGEPATVDGDDLLRRVKAVAAYSLMARYWPAEGSGHHDTARVVGGFLARIGLEPETVHIHVEAIARAANSPRWKELRRTAKDAAEAFAAGKHTFGFGGLCEAFGDLVARRVAEWLDYRGDTTAEAKGSTAAATEADRISLDDFRAYMPAHNYFYLKSREPWPASSINNRFDPIKLLDAAGNPVLTEKGKTKTIPASQWLDQNRPVEQMTWAPGEPTLIADRLVSHGGWIRQRGVTCLNLYMPAVIMPGDAAQATIWIEHVYRVFPNEGEHIILWLAHRVQRPAEKINHALVLGGLQGMGKDSMLEPLKGAVGPWNFLEVSPSQILGRFNGFLKAIILRVSEARDLGDVNRYQFYDHMKAFTAAPPDVLRVDEKNLREHSIFNVCGIIITTNHKADGIYLPADDRRHFVAWSDLTKDDFAADYWNKLWRFYRDGGSANVAAYLRELDISKFDPKAPPPKTAAFWDIVDANRAPEDAELADVLDRLGNPDAVTIIRIANEAAG